MLSYKYHCLSINTIIKTMAKSDQYAKATAERKWNYIFLLHARYDGKYARLARAMGIPQAELKNWDVEFKKDVLQWIENNRVIRGDQAVDESDRIPTIDELIVDCQKRLGSTIGAADDPSALARTIKVLVELQREGANNGDKKTSDVSQAVEERLRNKK